MNHARDNVFSCAALALNEHRHIGSSELGEPVAHDLHRVSAAENDVRRRHLPERLHERVDSTSCHVRVLPSGGRPLSCTRRAKGVCTSQLIANLIYVVEQYQLTKEPLPLTTVTGELAQQ